MAAPIFPTGVNVQGTEKVIWVVALSSTTAPTVAQLTAGTGLDLSCYLYEGGWQPDTSSNKVSAKRRLCSRKVYEKFGITTDTLGDLMYMISPQGAAGSDGKKAYEALTEGATGWFVERLGLDATTVDIAAGQFVNIYPAVLGPRNIQGDTADEASEYMVKQPVGITGVTYQNVVVAA